LNHALAQVVGGRTFVSVRKHRNYRLYFTGQAVSFTGTWMQQIAASWLVLQLTHSAVAVGALALAQLLPVTVFGLFVGTLIDRLDVRRTAIACEFLSMVTAVALAVLTLTGRITVWELYFLATVQGLVNAVDGPARHSLIFQMVGPEDLHNAVSLSSSLGTVARILGPAIGGAVVAFAGPGECFAINAASFFAILLSLLALDRARLVQPARDRAATLLRGAADALRYVRGSQRAGVAFAVVFVLATFSFNFNVLLPLVADRTLHRGAQTFGLIAAIFGAGALCGALVNAIHGVASLRRLLIGAIGFGAFELALAPQHTLFTSSPSRAARRSAACSPGG
jgi:MFS family permease